MLDRSAPAGWGAPEPWSDGFVIHAPVGSFRPNPFGIHDVIGNVCELCRDVYTPYDDPVQPGDGLRLGTPSREVPDRVVRGGSYHKPSFEARTAYRLFYSETGTNSLIGVRPARYSARKGSITASRNGSR